MPEGDAATFSNCRLRFLVDVIEQLRIFFDTTYGPDLDLLRPPGGRLLGLAVNLLLVELPFKVRDAVNLEVVRLLVRVNGVSE